MGLTTEIEKGSRQLKTDGYPMSIGELLNLYRDCELDLHPDFQRFFRWDDEQKSRLIESILLGIPLPSVFVFQRKDGVWDVIDGVQRLSTILQFVGVLKDNENKLISALTLKATRYLPSLEGVRWEPADSNEDEKHFLTSEQRIAFRRSKIDIKIVKSESTEQSKYDLFQRLNTGGTPATEQEVRNCILIMQNKPMYEWLSGLANDEFFLGSIALSERVLGERYEVELALRFILLKMMSEADLRKMKDTDLARFLTERMIAVAEADSLDRPHEGEVFKKTFKFIYDSLEDNAFKKYDAGKGRFIGSFSVSGFESVALGIGSQFSHNLNWQPTYNVEAKIKDLWSTSAFTANMGTGVSSSARIPKIVPFARTFFA